MLDNVARKAPPGALTNNMFNRRSACISCASTVNEPLHIGVDSALCAANYNKLPEWACYESIVRKQNERTDNNNVSTTDAIAVMKNVTFVDPTWLGKMAKGSPLLKLGTVPLDHPMPAHDKHADVIACNVKSKFGDHSRHTTPMSL